MSSQSPHAPIVDHDEIDLAKLFLTLWGGKWLIAFVTVLATALSVCWALNIPPAYQATSLLQLEEKAGTIPFTGGLEQLTGGGDPRSVTEIELLKSRLVLGEAVADQNLDWSAEPRTVPFLGQFVRRFGGLAPLPGFLQPFAQGGERIELNFLQLPPHYLGENLRLTKTSEQTYDLALPNGDVLTGTVGRELIDENSGVVLGVNILKGAIGREFILRQSNQESTIKRLRGNLGVAEKGRSSGVLFVTFKDHNPLRAEHSLAAIVNAYLGQNISRNSAEAESSLQFIEGRLPEVRATVDRIELQLKNFQNERNTLNLTLETQSLLEQQTQIELELANLEIEEQELGRKFTPNHPTYKTLLTKKKQAQDRLNSLKERSKELPETQREILDITQELALARETYSKLLIRAQELRVVKASTIGNVRVVDQAFTASIPVEPKKSRIVLLGALLGIMVGVGLVLLRNHFRKGIVSSSEIETLGLPVFAVVNRVKGHQQRLSRKNQKWPILALENPTEVAVESFRSLRTSLHYGMLNKESKVLAITSASPEVGKSFSSVNLAVVSALTGKKVCLIDADMRRGQLRRYFGISKKHKGLADFLAGSEKLEDVLVTTEVSALTFVPSGDFPPNPAELLMQPALEKMLMELSEEHDLIIVDCPPVLAVTDAMVVSEFASMTLAVVRFGETTSRELQSLLKQYEVAGGEVSGAIFNAYAPNKSDKYRSYDYRYEYK